MIEIEKTYLVKYLPEGYEKFPSKEIVDSYIPGSVAHPNMRLRKSGSKLELTKKQPVEGNDSSHQLEQTIKLSEVEYATLDKINSKVVSKIRYEYPYFGLTAEIDVFQGELEGLVVVDFEFTTLEERDSFVMPDFCLADVTQDLFIAGGMLCGKKYADIEEDLEKYNYEKIVL
jgi:adenylate cyclase